MLEGKNIKMFSAIGLLALTGIFRPINLTLPTSTPTASIKPLLNNPNLINKIQQIKLEFTNKRGELNNVKVLAKDATSITVDNAGESVKVDFQSTTHFRRKFWGVSNINEISVGDSVNVIGRWTSETKTEIKAVLIRDLSIQKRQGVFFGTVKTITNTGFVMTTIQRGDEAVTLDSSKIIDRQGRTLLKAAIQVGDKIRVRGLWDSQAFTITEVTEVKDFSLPPFTTPTAAP